MQMTSRQPSFTMPWQERQSRLTTFFRWLLVIPAALWVSIWGLALIVTVPIAWFAVLFTGRYPQALYEFHASFARYLTKVYGYYSLATDTWPGFSGTEDDGYPVRLLVGPPLTEYSRLKVALRIFLMIPVLLIAYAMQIVAGIASLIAWFAIVITGKLPEGIHQMIRLGVSYQQRALPYYMLMTEDWPTFTVDDERPALEPVPPAPQAPPPPAGGDAPQPVPRQSDAPPNLGDFRPPTPPDDAA
jgi:hypothetical protein